MIKYIQDVLKRRAAGEKGFSLVELAVVVVVMGILVAIAIPVFTGMQQSAREAAAETLAANASSMTAVMIANEDSITVGSYDSILSAGDFIAVTGSDLDDYCVVVTTKDGETAAKGADCPASPTAITASTVASTLG